MSSRPQKLRQALAAANLINLAHPLDSVIATSADWTKRQEAQFVDQMVALAGEVKVDDSGLGARRPRLYASFHYSIYGALYRCLGLADATRTVFSLIGEQSNEHQVRLQTTAKRLGFDIEFVHSTRHMVRTLRNAIAEGRSAIILVDIPWGTDDQALPDIEYKVAGGSFVGRSTLGRLLILIDPHVQFACARREDDVIRLEALDAGDLHEAFACFGSRLLADPADYERLHELHHFFRFDRKRDAVITFETEGSRLALHSGAMKWWKFSPDKRLDVMLNEAGPASLDATVCREISNRLGAPVDACISL